MSTCPDSDLYSALLDGEVPSPWKEKLMAHMENCPACERRYGQYERIREGLRASATLPEPDEAWLEASYRRLSERTREQSAPSTLRRGISRAQNAWARRTVRMPLPALAAVLAAAVVLPSSLVFVASRGSASDAAPQTAALLHPAGAMTVSRDSPIYSPDPLPQSVTGQLLVSNPQLFTMVDFAKQFSTDGDLFNTAEIIIIKLPDLTHFGGIEDSLLAAREGLLTTASMNK